MGFLDALKRKKSTHPLEFVKAELPPEAVLTFVTVTRTNAPASPDDDEQEYVAADPIDTLLEETDTFPLFRSEHLNPQRIAVKDITPEWLSQECSRLENMEELVLISRVELDNKVFHLGMVDFKGRFTNVWLRKLRNTLLERYGSKAQLYESGNSYHMYVSALLTPEQWLEFQGALLLMQSGKDHMADVRWIGRNLVRGYSALRWSRRVVTNANVYSLTL